MTPPQPKLPLKLLPEVAEQSDASTLLNLAKAEIELTSSLELRAKHANVWSKISNTKDLEVFIKNFSNQGNAFLLGKDLEPFYNDIQKIPKDILSPIYLILSWESPKGGMGFPWMNQPRFMEFKYENPTEIILKVSEPNPWHVIEVPNLERYIKKDADNLETKILYFKGDEFKLHTAQIMYKPFHHQLLGFTQHRYEFDMEHLYARGAPNTAMRFFLEEKDSQSIPNKPKVPWHERK